eukprot:jgi/Botrbrau1/16590/Bobra.0068s0020.1
MLLIFDICNRRNERIWQICQGGWRCGARQRQKGSERGSGSGSGTLSAADLGWDHARGQAGGGGTAPRSLYDNVQAQAAVGNAGFPVLCGILREERGDVDMVRGALECLAIALGHPAAGGAAASALEGQRRGAMNAELFARGKENVALLLGLLEEDASPAASDFYVRYHALQLLTCCAMAGSYRLQEAVLAAPLGVNKLLDMMEDGREVIRNEAILLLLGLTRTSADLQKIAAFQGAFPRLLNTVREEGGIEGGITVQDCLDLLNNLIRGNPQTQLMFREEGHMGALVALLKIGPSNSLSRQRAANLGALLNTLLLLVAPPPPDKQDEAKEASRLANQAALAQAGAVEALLSVALGQGGSSASPIRAQALRCMGLVIAGVPSHAERLMAARVEGPRGAVPAVQVLLKVALDGREAPERAAADSVVRAFCSGNLEGQTMLAATLMPIGGPDEGTRGIPAEPDATFGAGVLRALSSPDPALCARGAAALQHLLVGNSGAKERVLRMTLPLRHPEESSPGADAPSQLLPYLLHRIPPLLATPSTQGSAAVSNLLRTVATWLQECPPAVTAFLAVSPHLPLLLHLIHKRLGDGCTVVTGLAAVVLGECIIYNPDSFPVEKRDAGGVPSSSVLGTLTSKVGLAAYFGILDDLKGCPSYQAAASGNLAPPGPPNRSSLPSAPGPNGERGEEEDEESSGKGGAGSAAAGAAELAPLDRDFVVFLPSFEEEIRRRAMGLFGTEPPGESLEGPPPQNLEGASDAEKLQQAEHIIQALKKEVEDLKGKGAALLQQAMASGRAGTGASPERPLATAAAPILASGPSVADRAALREAEARAAKAESQAASLRSQFAELQKRAEEAEGALAQMQRVADEARGHAAKWEADLEDLSQAYTNLEQHSVDLEARLSAALEAAAHAQETDRKPEEDMDEEEDADDGMNDLLICLGQEERKVEILSNRLRELGVDVDALLAELVEVEEEEEEPLPGSEGPDGHLEENLT